MPEALIQYPCPICRKPVVWAESRYKPFCSERCRLIDLGEWVEGRYVIEGEDHAVDQEPRKEKEPEEVKT